MCLAQSLDSVKAGWMADERKDEWHFPHAKEKPRRCSPGFCFVQLLLRLNLLCLLLTAALTIHWLSGMAHAYIPLSLLSPSFTLERKHQALLTLPFHHSAVASSPPPNGHYSPTWTERMEFSKAWWERSGSNKVMEIWRGPLYSPKSTGNWVLFLTLNLELPSNIPSQ